MFTIDCASLIGGPSSKKDHIDEFIDELLLYILCKNPYFEKRVNNHTVRSRALILKFESMKDLRGYMRTSILSSLSSETEKDFTLWFLDCWFLDWKNGNPDNDPDFDYELKNIMMSVVSDIFGRFADGSEWDEASRKLTPFILKMCEKHYFLHPELLKEEDQ